jgi:hypothetical protein
MDLGHEIFIWFVFLPLLLIKRDGAQNPKEVIKSFLSAPVVIAILAGILFNLLGAGASLYELPVTGALMSVFDFLSNLTVPLILIIVGYGIEIDRAEVGTALRVAAIRLVILIPLALLVNAYLIRDILALDPLFETALFTLLVLPPPFIIPLYTPPNLDIEEKRYINNVLAIHTVISVTVFIVYLATNPLT